MTTVVWDGNVLVADSLATEGDKDDFKVISENVIKIHKMKRLTYKGQSVQALALSGSTIMFRAIGDYVAKEITDQNYFYEAKLFNHYGTMLLILSDKVVKVRLVDGEVSFHEYPRDQFQIIGSGQDVVNKEKIINIAPELIVSYAMKKDLYSGGSLTIWNGVDVVTNITPIVKYVRLRFHLASI